MSIPYINIHSHLESDSADEFCVFNCITGQNRVPADGPFTAGIHPWYIDELWDLQLSELHLMTSDERCIAIGECGLDKLRGADPALQEQVFRAQIKMAASMEKPLIIHCVKRFREVLRCLKEEQFNNYFLLHGYDANPEQATLFLSHPKALFSFGTALLREGSNAEQVFRQLPAERCFLETDDKLSDIKKVYLRASEIKGLPLQELKAQLAASYKKVFRYGIG